MSSKKTAVFFLEHCVKRGALSDIPGDQCLHGEHQLRRWRLLYSNIEVTNDLVRRSLPFRIMSSDQKIEITREPMLIHVYFQLDL